MIRPRISNVKPPLIGPNSQAIQEHNGSSIVVPLVKAVQEQQVMIEQQQKEIKSQQQVNKSQEQVNAELLALIEALRKEVETLKNQQ